MKSIYGFLFLLLMVCPLQGEAQSVRPSQRVRAQAPKKTQKPIISPWAYGFSSTYSNRIYIIDDTVNRPVFSQSADVTYSAGDIRYSGSLSFSYASVVESEQPNAEFKGLSFSAAKGFLWKSQGINIDPYISASLPLSYYATKVSSERFGISTGVSLSKAYYLINKDFHFTPNASFSVLYSNHTYQDSAYGFVNPEYVFAPSLGGSLTYKKVVGVFGSFGLSSVVNKQGHVSQSFSNSQGIFWRINKNNRISAGHSYRASVLQPDGRTERIQFADELYSEFFMRWNLNI